MRYAAATIAGIISALALAAPLTDAEQQGRLIYEQGRTDSGYPFTAKLPYSPTPVPGTAFPCAGCHGADGRGGIQGSVIAPDIRWATLTEPRTVRSTAQGTRQRGAYTKRALRDALTRRLDPAGNILHPVMPRFQLALTDFDHLLAYMQRLD